MADTNSNTGRVGGASVLDETKKTGAKQIFREVLVWLCNTGPIDAFLRGLNPAFRLGFQAAPMAMTALVNALPNSWFVKPVYGQWLAKFTSEFMTEMNEIVQAKGHANVTEDDLRTAAVSANEKVMDQEVFIDPMGFFHDVGCVSFQGWQQANPNYAPARSTVRAMVGTHTPAAHCCHAREAEQAQAASPAARANVKLSPLQKIAMCKDERAKQGLRTWLRTLRRAATDDEGRETLALVMDSLTEADPDELPELMQYDPETRLLMAPLMRDRNAGHEVRRIGRLTLRSARRFDAEVLSPMADRLDIERAQRPAQTRVGNGIRNILGVRRGGGW